MKGYRYRIEIGTQTPGQMIEVMECIKAGMIVRKYWEKKRRRR